MLLPPALVARLSALLALAEGEKNPADGERLNALGAAERLLDRHGLRLRDLAPAFALAAPEPDQCDPLARFPTWRAAVAFALRCGERLTAWETNFLESLLGFPTLSPKQSDVLRKLVERALDGAA